MDIGVGCVAVCIKLWARKAKSSLVVMGVLGLLWLEEWGCVWVGNRAVVCAVANCVGGRWGAVGWEVMVMMVFA